MWTDISQFDIPDHLKTTEHGSSKTREFTDIGEVCVINSMFGKAKVREIRPKKKARLIWPLAVLGVTVISVAVWLGQDEPKPPEPMRIIVRSVASEDAATTEVNNSPSPAVSVKPQQSPGTIAKATVVAKPVVAPPVLPTVKSEPAKAMPAAKPLASENPNTVPIAPSNIQPKSSAEVQNTAKSGSALQPATQSVAEQPVATVLKKEKVVPAAVAEPLTESEAKIMPPAVNDPLPGQSSVQPN